LRDILVSNIQGFSLQDGPGIRTVVFLMGCGLHCPWCANPENMEMRRRPFVVASKCHATDGSCTFDSTCVALGDDPALLTEGSVAGCPIGALRVYGEHYTSEALIARIMHDKPYYDDGGGVTWSGGEALLQAAAIEPVMAYLEAAGVDQCAESCLFVPAENLDRALRYLDRMIVDVKILDANRCRDILGGDIARYLQNLETVFARCPQVTLRFPLVPGVTDDEENLSAVAELIAAHHPALVEVFSVHNLAETKYASLKMPFTRFEPAPHSQLEEVVRRFGANGQRVEICQL
jgi:pyruvate formate lyase activating enzyme